jgi:hypothetical protein
VQKIIAISARRWFDGCNTYTTIIVGWHSDDGKWNTDSLGMEYGYGDYYRQRVGQLLFPKNHTKPFWQIADEKGFKIFEDCTDVKRKSDLHNGGKR